MKPAIATKGSASAPHCQGLNFTIARFPNAQRL
jgi:hypothetical protein